MNNFFQKLFISAVIFSITPLSWGYAEFAETLTTTVEGATEITAVNPSQTMGTINPQTGVISPLKGQFDLKINTDDDSLYDLVLTSSVKYSSGSANAYCQVGSNPCIILANTNTGCLPDLADINDIKSGSPNKNHNNNVISYPIITNVNNFNSVQLQDSTAWGGLYYRVLTGGQYHGIITQNLSPNPTSDTYSLANDKPGVYEATITFSANRKP